MRLRRVLWNPKYKEYTWIVRLDTPSEGIWTTYPGRNCTRLPPFTPGCAPPFVFDCRHLYLDARRHLASGCCHLHPDARRHLHPAVAIYTRMFTSGMQEPDGRGGVFNFSGRTYSDHLIASTQMGEQPFCTVLWRSPEASWYLPPIFWDILL